tara:strand:- start:957 stop:1229 length:273 start_codon:yes stop_codon:yes gene_type:complete
MHPFKKKVLDSLLKGEDWFFTMRDNGGEIHISSELDDNGDITSVSYSIGTKTRALVFLDNPENEEWPHHLMTALGEDEDAVGVNYNGSEW